jgi:serine/threonine protein phosphatase PrpC
MVGSALYPKMPNCFIIVSLYHIIMSMEYFAKSDIGNHREQNEDFYFADDKAGLFIVADGMGGHKAGEVASKIAVESFAEYFLDFIKNNPLFAGEEKLPPSSHENAASFTDEHIKSVLVDAFKYANKKVFDRSNADKNCSGMGTTMTVCYTGRSTPETVFFAHIGDSRAYFLRGRDLILITEDHTLVGELCKKGVITYDEMFDHPLRNYLNDVVGTDSEITPDVITLDTRPSDLIILCSDGLNSMLRDHAIFSIALKFKNPLKVTEELIKKAKSAGGLDNVTVIAIKL